MRSMIICVCAGLAITSTTVARPFNPERDGTRPEGVTGRPSMPFKDETRPVGVTGRPSIGDKTRPVGVTGRPSIGDKTRPDGVTGRPSIGDKTGRPSMPFKRHSGSTRPGGVTSRPSKPDRPDCQAEDLDDRAKQYCCLKGLLTGEEQCPEGDKDRLPTKCTKARSTTAATTTKFKSIRDEVQAKLVCRPIRPKNQDDGDQNDDKEAEDPRRDTQKLSDKVKGLSVKGKKCVKDVKIAIEAVKALMQQWKGEPTRKPRKDAEELEKDTVADTFYDAVDVAIGAEELHKNFDEEHIGDTADKLLPIKEDDDGAPKQCKAEWQTYKEELDKLVDGFKGLPDKFKTVKAKTVKLSLEDIDLGNVDWSSAEDVCRFAAVLVAKMKELQNSLRAKLHHIRGEVCKKGAKVAGGPKLGALARCLHQKRKSDPEDAAANADVYARLRGKTNKIFDLLRNKCVAKPRNGTNAGPTRPSTKTRRVLRMVIRKACRSAEDKTACRERVAAKIKEVCKRKNPDAEVEVRIGDKGPKNRLRRLLSTDDKLEAEVNITQTGAQSNPDYEGGVSAELDSEVEVTSDTTEGTEDIDAPEDLEDIDDTGADEQPLVTTARPSRVGADGGDRDTERAPSAGSTARAMGAAVAMCVGVAFAML